MPAVRAGGFRATYENGKCKKITVYFYMNNVSFRIVDLNYMENPAVLGTSNDK